MKRHKLLWRVGVKACLRNHQGPEQEEYPHHAGPRKWDFVLSAYWASFSSCKKCYCDSSFFYANALPLRSMESWRIMAGTGYRTPLPEFKEVSGPKQWLMLCEQEKVSHCQGLRLCPWQVPNATWPKGKLKYQELISSLDPNTFPCISSRWTDQSCLHYVRLALTLIKIYTTVT